MPGSASAPLFQARPLDLVFRATVAFGTAFWLTAWLGPVLLNGLLPFYAEVVHGLDDHYRIELAVTYLTGHDRIGSDLAVLVRATVTRTFMFLGADRAIPLAPGTVLKTSTAVGLLLQPATAIVGLALGWPLRGAREALVRGACAATLVALWLLLGVPASLWLYLEDIPIQVYAPHGVSVPMAVGKLLLNGGGVVLGALLGAGAVAAGRRANRNARSS